MKNATFNDIWLRELFGGLKVLEKYERKTHFGPISNIRQRQFFLDFPEPNKIRLTE